MQLPLQSQARADSVYAQSGDVTASTAVVWRRCNRESDAYLIADASTSDAFNDGFEFQDDCDLTETLAPLVKVMTGASDCTGSIELNGLQPNTTY